MSRGFKQTTNLSIITSAIEGKSLGEIEKTWQELAASEMRLKMMDSLIKFKVGFNEVEYFNLGLKYNAKTLDVKLSVYVVIWHCKAIFMSNLTTVELKLCLGFTFALFFQSIYFL